MAVFFETGNGDIYGGATREDVIAEIRSDAGEDFNESDIFEVPGTTKMRATDENEAPTGDLVTLDDAYTESLGAYCIASEN